MADPSPPADFDLRAQLDLPGFAPAQSPYSSSRRVWSGVLALVAGITADPTVQQALIALLPSMVPTPYVPVASAVLSAMLAWRSKQQDPRPIRGAP